MSQLTHSIVSNITMSGTSIKSSSLSSSAVGVVPPAVPRSIEGAVGAAAILQVWVNQAAVIANATANAVSSAHSIIPKKHCTMFLQRAFGINPDGTAVDQAVLPNRLKKYKSVKTVEQ
jgi:hypothetical protein